MSAMSTIHAERADPRLAIGGNNPPEPTPYEAIRLHFDDLMETAQGFLDGEPITTQAQADDIGRLLDEARQAQKAAEAQRKIEAKPFDEGKAAVQALWTPLSDDRKGKAALIADTCKKALAPFLAAQQAMKDALAKAAREAADKLAEQAREAARAAAATDLAAREKADALIAEAEKANRLANRAEKDKAGAAGGARAVTLRTVHDVSLVNAAAALKHYRERQPEALKAWLIEQAEKDVRTGARDIPGFGIVGRQVAQ